VRGEGRAGGRSRVENRWSGLSDSKHHLLAPAPAAHLSYRFVARLRQAFSGGPPSRGRQLAAAAGALIDVMEYRWLRHPDRPIRLAPRWCADAAEQALWSATSGDSVDASVLLGLPLTFEAGIRLGPSGLVVPAGNATASVVARRLAGKDTHVFPYFFQFLGVIGGWALAGHDRRRYDHLVEERSRDVAADARRAFLSGEHAVAMGADNVVDLLAKTAPLLTGTDPGTYVSPIHIWKAELAGEARSEASYLADAGRRWQQRHNLSSPILAFDVEVTVRDGDKILLLRSQEVALDAVLDGLGLAGSVELVPDVGRGHVSGRELRLRVGVDGREVEVVLPESVEATPVPPLNVAFFAPAMMAVWLVVQTHPTGENAPVAAVLPSVALAVATSVRAALRGAGDGRAEAVEFTVVACTAIAILHTMVVTPRMRNTMTREGVQPHPFASTMWAPLFLLGVEGQHLRTRVRLASWMGLGLVTLLGLTLQPERLVIGDVLAALQLGAVAYYSSRGWGQALEAQAADLDERFASRRDDDLDGAFRAGVSTVLDVVSGGIGDLRRRFAEVGDQLDPATRDEAARRLVDLEGRLARLRQDAHALPSTGPDAH